jgi:hypothetical protein
MVRRRIGGALAFETVHDGHAALAASDQSATMREKPADGVEHDRTFSGVE